MHFQEFYNFHLFDPKIFHFDWVGSGFGVLPLASARLDLPHRPPARSLARSAKIATYYVVQTTRNSRRLWSRNTWKLQNSSTYANQSLLMTSYPHRSNVKSVYRTYLSIFLMKLFFNRSLVIVWFIHSFIQLSILLVAVMYGDNARCRVDGTVWPVLRSIRLIYTVYNTIPHTYKKWLPHVNGSRSI